MYKKPEIETQVVKPAMSTKVDGKEFNIITEQSETALEDSLKEIVQYIMFNNGFGQSDEAKDELYTNAKKLWDKYVDNFRKTNFTIHMNKKQFDYLTEMLRDKIEYDVNTLFFAIDLTDTLGTWVTEGSPEDDVTVKSYDADPVSVNYLYHLVSTVKVKGLTDEAYTFSQVLRRIYDVNRVVNFYDNNAKSLSKDIQEWVANFEPQEANYNNFQPQFN